MVKPGRRYELGEDARTHLLEHLGTWGDLEWKPLGGKGIDPATGQVYAFLPSGLTAKELTIEALNRITYERSYEQRSGPAALLRAHLQTENAVYVVPEVCPSFQEMLTWPKDWLPPLAVGCDDRAFRVWTSAVDDLGRLEDALGATEDWHYRGFLTYSAALRGRTGSCKVTLQDLRELVAETRAVIFGAFDGCGYLVWERS